MSRTFLLSTVLTLAIAGLVACQPRDSQFVPETVVSETATRSATESQSTPFGSAPTAALPVPTEVKSPTSEPAPTSPADGEIVTIDIGQFSDFTTEEPLVSMARDDQEWRELWASHRGGGGEVPYVDFRHKDVLAVFLGLSGGGDRIEVETVAQSSGQIIVIAVRRTPAKGCNVPTVITYPFHIVSVPRVQGDPRLQLRVESVSCS